jgi:hypothetical protein
MFHDSTGFHDLERLERLALPFLGQTRIGFDRFLDQPPTWSISSISGPIRLPGEIVRQMRCNDPGVHDVCHS